MSDQRDKRFVQTSVDSALSSVQGDPFLARRIIQQERKDGIKVKKKFSTGLIVAIVLALLTATALAAALLSPKEVVEQVAVPLARENDKDWRIITDFTPEQLAAFIKACSENGIDLDENNAIMEALRNGEGYDEEEAIMGVCRAAFGGVYGEWTLEERRWFQEMMVAIGFADGVNEPLPEPGDLMEADARDRMLAAIRAEYGSDLPLEDPALYACTIDIFPENGDDGAFWTLRVRSRAGGETDSEYFASLDREGNVLEVSFTVYEKPLTVDEVVTYRLTVTEAAELAADAVRAQTGRDVPLLDPEQYHYWVERGVSQPLTWRIHFISETQAWGRVLAAVDDATGEATVLEADVGGVTADTILTRYRAANGWYDGWDSALWAEIAAAAKDLPAETMEGKVVKSTPWIAWREGLLTKEEAEKQAFTQAGVRMGDVNCVSLIDDTPHPVWKFRILPWDGSYPETIVVEIDAVTGEMTDLDLYKSDSPLEPSFHMITLHRIWARLELSENGPLYLARLAVLKRFADLSFDEPEVDSLPIFDETYWQPAVEGNTVRFRSRWANVPDYQVVLDENGVATEVTELPSSGTETLPEDRLPGGEGNG